MPARTKATPKKPKEAREAEREARASTNAAHYGHIARAVALLILTGISSTVSQISLSPVYGAIPASLHHRRVLTWTALATFIGRNYVERFLPKRLGRYVPIMAYSIPLVQYYLFRYSVKFDVDQGPFLTELATYFPLLALSLLAARELLGQLDLTDWIRNRTLADTAIELASFATVSFTSKISASIIPSYVGTHLSLTRVGLQMLMGSLYSFVAPSTYLLLAAPAIIHTLTTNPHYPSDKGLATINSTLLKTEDWQILDRQESITGYISVLQGNEADVRVLRCDHSLLGGEWLVSDLRAQEGQTKPETIFSVFTLLEAVRLIEDAGAETEALPDSQKSALVVGLGIGTAPNALISHGINTTIVELDPVVHHYATKYFNLSRNHTAVIDDAVGYVAEKSRSAPESYNYIIHDVFTGGAEPVDLFTREFLKGLHDLLTDDGAVAINYAGDLALPSTKLILNTIHSIFPACRLYRDSPPQTTAMPGEPDFINMVVFCVKNDHGRGASSIAFRRPGESDFDGSIARRNFLMPKKELEIEFGFERGVELGKGEVLTRGNVGVLEEWQRMGAVSHWRIMRTVLPPRVWEMW